MAGSEGLRGAALIPVDDREVLFQRLTVLLDQGELGGARSAVNKQHNRIGDVLGTNENPLPGVVDWNLLENGQTVRVTPSTDFRG